MSLAEISRAFVAAAFVALIMGLTWMCWDAVAHAQEGPPEPSRIILEEPRPAINLDPPPITETTDQPDIPPQRPPSRDFVETLDFGGMEEIFNVGQDWDNDCKANFDEDQLLVCRLTW